MRGGGGGFRSGVGHQGKFGGGGVVESGWGVRVDVNEELKFLCKFKTMGSRGGGIGSMGVGWGCQGGCERRIEVFVKIQK